VSATEVIVRKFLCSGDRLFLNPFEEDLGRRIGEARFATNRQNGCRPAVIQDLDAVCANDRFGGMAEVAVARWLNVWPMTQFTEYLYYNLKLPGGDLIAVQWNDQRKAAVLDQAREVRRGQKHKEAPDLYIVLTGGITNSGRSLFEFVGWTTHAELLVSPVETLKHYGPRWVQCDLHERLDVLTCARGQGVGRGRGTSETTT